jgi:hypothetical protein
VGEEARLLAEARVKLGRGEPDAALEILGEHERRFPRGALVTERRALRILTLCGNGKRAQGRGEAHLFLAEHGDTALAAKIRNSCGPEEAP